MAQRNPGGVRPSKRLMGFASGWGRIFTTRLTIMGLHIFGFLGYESSSYLRVANLAQYLYCG